MSEPMVQNWLQYTHLDKLYGYLPGMPQAAPAIFGLDPAAYAEIIAQFNQRAAGAADRLLDDQRVAGWVDALPFTPGQKVLAVGDSTTDDLQSWAVIFRHLLSKRRGQDHIDIINAGLSAHTTAMMLRRWPATLAVKPDWIMCALGTNDVTRVGLEPTKPTVTADESIANLRQMRRIASHLTDASWVWLTPTPVIEERVASHPPFQYGLSTWRNQDITALAEAITALGAASDEPVIDLIAAFGTAARPTLYGPDGVHPTLDGQIAITVALLQRLASIP